MLLDSTLRDLNSMTCSACLHTRAKTALLCSSMHMMVLADMHERPKGLKTMRDFQTAGMGM